jgi:hypothetical protein
MWAAKAAKKTSTPRKGGLTAAGRKRLAEAMRKRWAAKRAAAKKSSPKKAIAKAAAGGG